MTQFKLDHTDLPTLTPAERARLDGTTDADLTAAALADADNPPLTDAELARLSLARRVQAVRSHTGLSQRRFSEQYHISIGRLRDLEQGRTAPDSALLAYLAVIEKEPEAVERALAG